jgi:predicted transcriptional regulator
MEYEKATRTAANIGKGFAVAMAVFGIFYNIWFILIAVFIYIAASDEERSSEISIALENLKVSDIMTHTINAVPLNMTLSEFSAYMHTHKHLGYPVIENQKLVGLMTINELHHVEKNMQEKTKVADVMRTDVLSISPDDTAISAFKTMMQHNHERLVVKNTEGVLGVLSWSDLLRAIKMKQP